MGKKGLMEIEGEILDEKLPVIEGDEIPFENIQCFLINLDYPTFSEVYYPWEKYNVNLNGTEIVVKVSKDWLLKVKEKKEICGARKAVIAEKIHQIPCRALFGFKKIE